MTSLLPLALALQDADGGYEGPGLIAWIVIGLLAGFIAEKVMKNDMGLLMNLVLGIVGALVGGFLFGLVGMDDGGFIWSLIVATVGAIVVLWIVGMLKKRGVTS